MFGMIDPLSRLLHRGAGRQGPVMLMYHAISPPGVTRAWPWALSLALFDSHLDFLKQTGWRTVTVSELLKQGHDTPAQTIAITFDDGYADNLAAAERLHQRGMCATFYVVSGSLGRVPQWPDPGRPELHMLSPDALCRLRDLGMEIGSHTQNHARLTDCRADVRMEELTASRQALETLLGQPVRHLAYPYGLWNAECEAAAKLAGYDSACTTSSGWALRDADPYQLRRLTVYAGDTASVLARKLSLGANDVAWFDVGRYFMGRVAQRLGWTRR